MFWPVAPGVRIEAELERIFPGGARVVVPRSVLGELDRLAALGVPNAETARRLAGSWPVSRSSGRGDDAVLDCARRLSGIVATADRGLIQRVRASGLSALVPRDRTRLELRPPLAGRTRRPPTVKTRSSVVGRRPRRG